MYGNMALEQARLATCPRLKVGALVVDEQENIILATAYNGAPTGEPHCLDVGCDVVNDHCRRAIHCETNLCVRGGRPLMKGRLVVITHVPCYACAGLLVQTGISRLAYLDYYRTPEYSAPGISRLERAGIEVWRHALTA